MFVVLAYNSELRQQFKTTSVYREFKSLDSASSKCLTDNIFTYFERREELRSSWQNT